MPRAEYGLLLAAALLGSHAPTGPRPDDAKPGAPTELHLVCVHEGAAGGTAAVRVDRPGVDVTLAVSAYNPVAWDVTATPRTTITKVLLCGYHRQTATVPAGTKVDDLSREGRRGPPYLYVPYDIESARVRPALRALREFTKQEVRSFRGVYTFRPADPLVVGRVQDDPRLASDYPRLSRAADVPKVKFQSAFLTPVGPHGVSGSFGEFTQAGPDKATLTPLPDRIVRIAHDPVGKKYYGQSAHDVYEVDLAKRGAAKINTAADKLSWQRGLTFDTRRGRLLAVSHTTLVEYAPAAGKWAAVADLPRGLTVSGLAYHAKDDGVYGLATELGGEGGRPVLIRMNAQGAILKSTRLGDPLFPGVLGRPGDDGRTQLVSAGTHLAAVIGGPLPREEDGRPGTAESFLFLIDPEDGKVTLGWKE